MFWLTGVAIALTATQQLEKNSYAATCAIWKDSEYEPEFGPIGLIDAIIALGFGTGISLAVLAITGGSGFWRDPERIGITVLGAIGIITFLTEMAVTTYVAKTETRLFLALRI